MKNKIFGTFEDGYGEIVPATKKARWLRLQFRSNRKKSAGGFRCQVSLQCGSLFLVWNIFIGCGISLFRFFNFFLRLLLLLPGLALALALVLGNA